MTCLLFFRHAYRLQRFLHALDNRLCQRDQCPYSSNTHSACTNKTDLLRPHSTCKSLHRLTVCRRSRHREIRHEAAPGNNNAHEHRNAACDTNKIARADECRRKTDWQLCHTPAYTEPHAELARKHTEPVGAKRNKTGNDTAGHDFLQAACILRRRLIRIAADLQDLSSCETLRIRQVAVDHHCAAQRNREKNAQTAAAGGYEQSLPELESLPVANHQKTRNDKDNGGQCPCCRRLRLYHIILQDIGILAHLQNCHGNNCCRNC